ncbi:MAG: hypothetical protein GWM98_02260 [Nitrospinaceae bacterium]|nr:hypothetical protein [Nitrospinaceae bacterium]NIR53533.1 hypothetical protein [Nitrospinaceae bacterium]NIS83934.1 hypothetical protein [Nitrospinaceae bacterium]NIT80743.1 hypothetical protein [Nitrospinaceae bacterium]NIU43049.1 hypothetical protein [Nitrospinaceae bacterium]
MTKVKMGDTVMLDARRKPMPHVVLIEGKWILYSKVTGKKHKIPLLRFIRPRPYAHQIRGHMSRTECSACHARWSANEWGMHVIHEEELDRDQWKNWTLSDPTLQQSLSETAEPRKPAASVMGMLNWNSALSTPEGIKGSWIKGVWNHVFTETGWNSLILGINQRNRATVMKPRYQYFLTTRSKPGGQQPDRAKVPVTVKGKPGWVMMPHTPHTTRATTRPCESCHLSPLAAGLGEPTLKNIRDGKPFYKELIEANRVQPQFQIKQMVSRNGWSLQNPLPKGKLRFMKSKEIKALLKKTTRYKAYRYLDLRRNGHSRLLIRDEYPYDLKHKINEEKMGPPTGEEKLLYYDLDRHQFFTTQQAEPAPAREPAQPPPPGTAELPIPQADMPESVSPVPPPLDSPPGQADFFIDLKSSEPDPDLPSAQE